ncbi:LysM peptidoglycan-binding domain-containing protein [Lentzea sp. JNUCC 0626]|uniref:LysM peptidoglycan-binding domain-containing protein n=1 Tax=Lentzea sp. JNUCC 0626 TaxID=3367513 RepID=UPI00374A2857
MPLVAVVVPPLALAHFVGWPLPDHLPTWHELQVLTQSPMSTWVLVRLLACLGWVLWLWLMTGVIGAIVSAVRHGEVSGAGSWMRRFSAVLVGSFVLSLLDNRMAGAAPANVRSVEVVEGDSLWRIADRTLGDGTRWPELVELNHGVVQPDGLALNDPAHIRPGWTIEVPDPDPPQPSPRTSSVGPQPLLNEGDGPPPLPRQDSAGVTVPTGAFVAAGLAAAVSTALASARMWQRRGYRPGSRVRADLERPQAPVVRTLRIVRDLQPEEPAVLPAEPEVTVGVRDGREVVLDLVAAKGLGLTGPGALAAVRAMLIHLVATGDRQIVVSEHDRVLIFGDATDLPSVITLVPDVDSAVDVLQLGSRPTVLIGRARPEFESTLSTRNASGLFLGQWNAGGTIRVHEDGTVSAATPELRDVLEQAKLYSLPLTDSAGLLRLFHEAEGAEQQADLQAPDTPLLLRVLGEIRLVRRRDDGEHDVTALLTGKQLELLAYLAVHHPQEVRVEALNAAVWPEAPSDRPRNSFNNATSRLRRALADVSGEVIGNDRKGRIRLNPDVVDTDLAIVRAAIAKGDPGELSRILAVYQGDFADDLTSSWVEPNRESIRRDLLDALGDVSRDLIRQPRRLLAVLEQVRRIDRYNESVYRDIMTVQAGLGQLDAVPRTMALLTSELAEIEHQPSRATIGLVERLLAHQPDFS